MSVLIGAGVMWFAVALLWSRIYYARRHGLGWGVDISAAFIGLMWPLTIFTLWRPALCDHRSHVLERGRLRSQYDAEDALIEQTRRGEVR
jgi:hypothetical protein